MVLISGMLDRESDLELVRAASKRSRVAALLGPRQCGRTTLARQFVAAESLNYFDLEDPQSLARLSEPDLALRPLKGLVVIDEIQRRPDLFPLLRVLADLKLDELRVVYPGAKRYTLAKKVEVVPLAQLVNAK
jgi:predicted AAA+ superfamily ATPase